MRSARKSLYSLVIVSIVISLVPQPLVAQESPASLDADAPQAVSPDPMGQVRAFLGDDPQTQAIDAALDELPGGDLQEASELSHSRPPLPRSEALGSAAPALPEPERPRASLLGPMTSNVETTPSVPSPPHAELPSQGFLSELLDSPADQGVSSSRASQNAQQPADSLASSVSSPQTQIEASSDGRTEANRTDTENSAPPDVQQIASSKASAASSPPHRIFLPAVYNNWQSVHMAGLSFDPPHSWESRSATAASPSAATDLADAESKRWTSPDGEYYLEVVVDWHSTTPEAPFGTFYIAPGDAYDQSFVPLESGELAQVVEANADVADGKHLLSHAAFRSGDASYALRLFGDEPDEAAFQKFQDTLGSMSPRPETLPEPSAVENFSAAVGASDTAAQYKTTATQTVSYTRSAAVQYANYWTRIRPLHNADGCYLWYNDSTLICDQKSGYWGLDGAHFINMALRAGGLDAPPLWASEGLQIEALRSWLLDNGGEEIANPDELQHGDVTFVGTDGCWGWGGVVIGQDGEGPLLNVHSWVEGGFTTDRADVRYTQMLENHCGTTNQYSFVHVNAPAGPPVDMEPPVIHNVDRWQNEGHSDFVAEVTDNVAVAQVLLVFNGENREMIPVGGDKYEVVVDVPLKEISEWYVVAIDTSANVATFPPDHPINLRGYRSSNLGAYNFIHGSSVDPCDPGNSGCSNDPVNTANGNFTYNTTDFTVKGLGNTDIVLERHYNSLPNEPVGVIRYTSEGDSVREEKFNTHPEPFGPGWTFPYAISLLELDNTLLDGVQVRYADGHTASFTDDGDGAFSPVETRVYDELAAEGSGYVLKRKNLTEYHFDANGRLTSITDRNGNAIILTYDGDRVVRVDNAAGRWMRFEYNDAGLISDVYAPEDVHLHYEYEDGRLHAFTNARRETTYYEYDEQGCLEKITTPKGHPSVRLEYNDELGRVTEQVVGGGERYAFSYDDENRVTTLTDAYGNQTRHFYDEEYRLVESQNDEGESEYYEYNDRDNRVYFQDREGREWHYTYDDNGNRLTQDGPLGYHTEFEYNELDLVTRIVEQVDEDTTRTTTYEYDEQGNLTETCNPLDDCSTIKYNERGLPTDLWDFAGNHTENTYDAEGDLIAVTNAEEETTRFDHDGLGRVIEMRTPLSNTYSYAYDPNGNLTAVNGPLGYHLGYRYDANDNLEVEIDPNDGETSYGYDASGNLITVADQLDHTTVYTYGLMNELTCFEDAERRTWTYEHDGLLQVTDVHGPLDTRTHFEYDAVGNVTDVTDPEGHVTHTEYDALNRPVAVTRNYRPGEPEDAETNVTTEYEYDLLGNVLRVVDPEGNPTVYEYDLLGRVTLKRDAEGREWEYAYDPMGNLREVINPRDYPTNYAYDDVYRLRKIIDAKDNVTTFRYDADGNLTERIDPLGVVTHYEYDALDRPVKEIRNYRPGEPEDAETNVTTEYAYDPAGNLRFVTDPRGYEAEFVYDDAHRLTDIFDYEGAHTHYTYDRVDNLLSVTDDNDHTTRYTYDDLDRRKTVTDPEEHTVEFFYDKVGNLTRLVDARDNPTRFEVDALGRVVKMTDAMEGEWRYEYDRVGNLLVETDANDHATTYTYDEVYRLRTVTDAEGNVSRFRWDPNGNLVEFIDGNQHSTTYGYDEMDRLTSVTNAEDETTEYRYDPLGNQTRMIEADDTVSRYSYDPLYRLNRVTENYVEDGPQDNDTNVVTRYAYDASDNLAKIINANGAETTFEHDGLGRVVREMDPLDNTWEYTYDGVGNRLTRRDANGDLTEYAYYPDDQLRRIDYPDGTSVAYTYDANDNRTSMQDWLGTTTWAYDALDRVTDVNDPFDRALHFEYDKVGNRTEIVYPDGNAVGYTYYDNDWLKTMVDPEGNVTSYRRDKVGNITQIINPNSTVTDVTYDKADRVQTLVNRQTAGARQTIAAFDYNYNEVGHVTQTTKEYGWRQPSVVTETYAYDGLHRLSGMEDSEGVEMSYAYDRVGNRLSWETNDDLTTQTPFDGFSATYEYNAANQLTKANIDSEKPNADRMVEFTYDANGNRTGKLSTPAHGLAHGTDYAYDFENRLVEAQDYQLVDHGNRVDRAVTTLQYDGGGRRMVKTYDPKTGDGGQKRMEYVFDGLDPVAEYDMLNGQRDNYYRGALNRIATRQHFPAGAEGQMYWYHYNFKGDVVGLTKHHGQSTHNYRYDPYGGVVPARGNWTDPHNHYTLTGKEYDEHTELVYFGARHYDSFAGIWLTQDIHRGHILTPFSLHRYSYVLGNPTRYYDAYGYFINLGTAAIGAAAGGAIAYGSQVFHNVKEGGVSGKAFTDVNLKAVGVGAAAGAVGGLTFGAGLAAGGAAAGALGVTSASGATATAVGATTVAVSGAAAGQTSRATANVFYRDRAITEGLGRSKDLAIDAVLSLVGFKVFGGNFKSVVPSDVRHPGPYARKSIPATKSYANAKERQIIQDLGAQYGCHTCGTKQGYFVADHQPPLSSGSPPEAFYPQCQSCSAQQSVVLRWPDHGHSTLVNTPNSPVWLPTWTADESHICK